MTIPIEYKKNSGPISDTSAELEGYEDHLDIVNKALPEIDRRTPAEKAAEEQATQEQQAAQQQPQVSFEDVANLAPEKLQEISDQLGIPQQLEPLDANIYEPQPEPEPEQEFGGVSLEEQPTRQQNRFVQFESPDGRLSPDLLLKEGHPQEFVDAISGTYTFRPEEKTKYDEYQSAGGSLNPKATLKYFLSIRNDPRDATIHDRNKDGDYTISDYYDLRHLNLTPDEDKALTEQWLNDMANPTFAGNHRLSKLLGQTNMTEYTYKKRLGTLGPQGSFFAGQGGEQSRGAIVGGLLDSFRFLAAGPEKLWAAEKEKYKALFGEGGLEDLMQFVGSGNNPIDDAWWKGFHSVQASDSKIANTLLPVSDPLSPRFLANHVSNRFWSDKILYEAARYAPAIPIAARVPGGLTSITGGGAKIGTAAWTKSIAATTAKGIATTAITETIPMNAFVDFSTEGMGAMYDENTTLKKIADAHPTMRIAGMEMQHWITTPHGRWMSHQIDEIGYDSVALFGFQSLIKGSPKALRLVTKSGNGRASESVMEATISTSLKPHSLRKYSQFDGPQSILKERAQRFNDAAEAALDQQKIQTEGPSSKWLNKYSTFAEQSTNYGDFKNLPINVSQGKAPKRSNLWNITNQIDEFRNRVGVDEGAFDSLLSPTQKADFAKRGLSDTWVTGQAADFWNSRSFASQLNYLDAGKRTLGNYSDSTLRNIQEIIGRDSGSLSPKEFWGDTFVNMKLKPGNWNSLKDSQKFIIEKLTVADAVVQSLLKEVRNIADAGGELLGKGDIFVPGGTVDRMSRSLAIGLSNIKKTQMTWNLAAKKMSESGGLLTDTAVKEINQHVARFDREIVEESGDGVQLLMKLMKNHPSEDIAEAVLDVFKMSDDIHNWKDIDAWMRQKISGGEFNGKVKTGAVVKELQAVMINSILSGPKTPMRAILGTATNSYLNALNQAAGAIIRQPFTKDVASTKASMAKLKGMIEIIPESIQVFRRNFKSKMNADIADIRSRYSEGPTREDYNWNLMREWTDQRGNLGDKAAFILADNARTLNNNKLLSWSPRTLAATDDTFRWILARARAKEVGMRQALEVAGREQVEFSPQLFKQAEDIYYKTLLDADGNVDVSLDSYLQKEFKEVTLTSELKGWSKELDSLLNEKPLLKPFYLFARTGINGLNLTYKNTPLLGALHKESLDILKHTGSDYSSLFRYGIENADDLANARNLFAGRQAVGSAVVMSVAGMYMAGHLTGNGPADKKLRQSWINSGTWKPNYMYFGDVGFEFSALEPYNAIFSSIADIGDNIELMGSEWAESKLQAVAFVIGRGLSNKTYMSGLDQLFQMLQFKPGAWTKGTSNIMNNSLPLAGLRNEFGKWINPHMKELNSDLWSSLRNKNQSTEFLAQDPLPEKSDLLNGNPINNWNIVGRSVNAVSPIQIDIRSNSPGRKLLRDSNYDLKTTTYSYGGYSFTDNAHVRAYFQNEIGKAPISIGNKNFNNLEEALEFLATQEDIQNSMARMQADSRNPQNWDIDPNNYPHNTRIDGLFNQARSRAWAVLNNPKHPGYRHLQEVKQEKDGLTTKTRDTRKEILDLSFPQTAPQNIPSN